MTIADAITLYLEHAALSSAGTARAYETPLNHFRRYLAEQGLDPATTEVEALTLPIWEGFILWMQKYLEEKARQKAEQLAAKLKGKTKTTVKAKAKPKAKPKSEDEVAISRATRTLYLGAIATFHTYLALDRDALPMSTREINAVQRLYKKARRYRTRAELPPTKLPSEAIIARLREVIGAPLQLPEDMAPGERRRQELARLRNIAMVEALLSSGMRVGEMCSLQRQHLLHAERGATIPHTKGQTSREVLFSEEAWEAIWVYLRARQDGARGRALAAQPVFARHDRRAGDEVLPLSTKGVQKIFRTVAEQAEIAAEFHLTPHTLRHFFGTEFLSETGDLALTQYAMGHSNPNTTRIYARTKRDDYLAAHREVSRRKQGKQKIVGEIEGTEGE